MLHTITQEWPTPSAVKQYDSKTKKIRGFSEVERRQSYIDKMPEESRELKPVVISCLGEDPNSRSSISDVCDNLKKMNEGQHSDEETNLWSLLAQKAQLEGEVNQKKVENDRLKIDIDRKQREINKQKKEAEQQRIETEQQRMEAERQKKVVNRYKKQIDDLQEQLKLLTPLSQTNLVNSTVEKAASLAPAQARQQIHQQQQSQLSNTVKSSATIASLPTNAVQQSTQMSSINSTVAIQLQKSKQQLQELNQKLLTGYQRLNELHKHPNQEDNIAQLNSQLKLGVQQRQRLQQIIQQMNLQIQRQQPSVTQSPNATVQDSLEFSLALKSGQYQMDWTTRSSLPTAMWRAHATIINSIMYIGGGTCSDVMEMYNVYAYHFEEDRWDCLPPLQQYYGVPVNITEKLTIIGGCDYTHKATNKVTAFSYNSWKNDIFPNLLMARLRPAAVSYKSKIIVAGGKDHDDKVHNNIEVLDITTLQWKIINIQLPEPMYAPSAAMCGESLVIVGFTTEHMKRSNKTFLIDVDKVTTQSELTSYTGEDNMWSSLANAPYYQTALTPSSYSLVIIGGSDKQGKTTNDITIYDDVTKSWRRVSSLPLHCAWATATIINNEIIVAGGCMDTLTNETCNAASLTSVVMGHPKEIN